MRLKEKLEEHILFFFLSTLFVGFISGLGAYKVVMEIARLEVLSKSEVEQLRKFKEELERVKSAQTNNSASQSTKPRLPEKIGEATPPSPSRISEAKAIAPKRIGEENFLSLLKEGDKLLGAENYGAACRKYRDALDVIPEKLRGSIKQGFINQAITSYGQNKFPDAAKQYAEVFRNISR